MPNACYSCVGRIVPIALGWVTVAGAEGYTGHYMKCFSTHMLHSRGFRCSWRGAGGINGVCRGRRSLAASRRLYTGSGVGGSVVGEVTSSRRQRVLLPSQSEREAVYMLWLFVSVRISVSFLTALLLVLLALYTRVLVRTGHMEWVRSQTQLCQLTV